MSNDDRFNRWNAWLEVVYDDVQGLLINRQIYREVQGIIDSNAKIQIESAYYEWVGIIYASTQAIGVRRQIDPRPDVISFVNLFGEIKNNPEVLSRQRYVALHVGSGRSKEAAELDFDRFAGKGGAHVDPAMVDADLADLRQKADKIRLYVNRRISHFDRSDFKSVPTIVELNDCMDLLEMLLKKYLKLFRASADIDIVPAWQYDWKRIFRIPWIE